MEELVMSPLCRTITQGGHTVEVNIYRSDESGWTLEVADALGNLAVWNEQFESDQKALDEVNRAILEEGIDALVGPASSFEAWEHLRTSA